MDYSFEQRLYITVGMLTLFVLSSSGSFSG